MLVYQATKREFMDDVDGDVLVENITRAFEQRVSKAPSNQVLAWQNSMQHMYRVLNTPDIPSDCGVAIEFNVPYTSSRIDFVLTGSAAPKLPEPSYDAAVIIELKQWQEANATTKDGIVTTRFSRGVKEAPHPSYQAWSYAQMIENYNEAVRDEEIVLLPCAYLHNYKVADSDDPLLDERYAPYWSQAPVFGKGDVFSLRAFICRHIARGDDGSLLFRIDSGRLRPSKSLQDALAGMLDGNDEFVMIDDQKLVFEGALELAREARDTGRKRVMIVRGGPGTGKSVVAVNLLVRLTADDMVVQYVSKNSAPRNVYSFMLRSGRRSKAYIDGLFNGPGRFHELAKNSFGALVVDEAHRLVGKGAYMYRGESQVKDLVDAAHFSVFFIDESQRVTTADTGAVADIKMHARRAGARVVEAELSTQFRCDGSDEYLRWLDDVLGIRSSDEPVPGALAYDFRVFDDPNKLHDAIVERNETANKSRVVAGYCWEWDKETRSNTAAHDIVLEEHGFRKSWNLDSTSTWAIDAGSVDEIGCVHTCQGLEFDYVGVIIGDDLRFEDGRVVTDSTRRAKSDKSLKGLKKLAKTDPERADAIADEIIRNTYRVLMTRGMKGCYVYCTDAALAAHLWASLPAPAGAARYNTAVHQSGPFAAEDRPEE